MVKRQTPKRSYTAVIDSLRQVWKIELVEQSDSIWQRGAAEQTEFSPSRIRVAVWNLCKGAGGRLFEHDYRSLCYRSDLILAQEALLSARSIEMFCESGFHTVHAASYRRRDGLRDGVMTASRVTSLPDEIGRVVCKYPEPLFKTPKVALIRRFPIAHSGQTLLVINIHATLVRLKRAAVEEMEHLLAHLPDHQGPILLAGDFNTFTPGYLKAISEVLARLGLKYVPIPNDPRPLTQALDQVFVRGLTPSHVRVDTGIKNSDHFPILAEFAVTAP